MKDDEWYYWENKDTRIFPGFYNTLISPEIYERECEQIDTNYDFWCAYKRKVGEKAFEIIKKAVNDYFPDIIRDMKYMGVWSPTFYDHVTDKLALWLKVDWKRLDSWVSEEQEPFGEYLKERYTDRPGVAWLIPNEVGKLKASKYYKDLSVEYFIFRALDGKDMDRELYDYATDSLELGHVLT